MKKPRPIFERKCLHCGITFPSKMPWANFCCTPHRLAEFYVTHKAKPVMGVCDWCHEPFKKPRPWSRFCKDDCRMAFHYNIRHTSKRQSTEPSHP